MICNLINGESFEIFVDLKKLLLLKSEEREKYTKFNNITLFGAKDIFDMMYLIYCCYRMNNDEKTLSYEGFIKNLPEECQTISFLSTATQIILNGKKSKKIENDLIEKNFS